MTETLVLRVTCDGPQCINLEDIHPELKSPSGWHRLEETEILAETEQGTQVKRTTYNFCSFTCLVASRGQEWIAQAEAAADEMEHVSDSFAHTMDIFRGRTTPLEIVKDE